jgi:hypothetical protein
VNKLGLLFLMLLVLFTLHTSLRAELLIVKKVDNVFVPLDSSDDKNGKAIADILLKYEWPMCIANEHFTDEEKRELLAPNKPYAEELFIQKKIREALPNQPHQYSVVFIPTVLYELFCIEQAIAWDSEVMNPFIKAARETLVSAIKKINHLDIIDIINSSKSAHAIRKEIYDMYVDCNNVFYYNNGDQSAFLYINNVITKKILDNFPDFKDCDDGLKLSERIKGKSNGIAAYFITEILKSSKEQIVDLDEILKLAGKVNIGKEMMQKLEVGSVIHIKRYLEKELSEHKIVSQVLSLEYKARGLNKALIFRGNFNIRIGESSREQLFGSTLRTSSKDPYSISFGNSLFAGIITESRPDNSATVYMCIIGRGEGYSLFINKIDYIEHQCNNLFFIPSISPICALFQRGEFFHPRTKAAIIFKEGIPVHIYGIWQGNKLLIKDPTGVILITRNPMRHAELFSKYIFDNGRFISSGPNFYSRKEKKFINYTEEERKFIEDRMKKSQTEATEFYKAIRITEDAYKQKIKQKKEDSTTSKPDEEMEQAPATDVEMGPVSFLQKLGSKIKFAFRKLFQRKA